MYLSDRDLVKAIDSGSLIVDPRPKAEDIGASSIDLHLDSVAQALIWDVEKFESENRAAGRGLRELHIGKFDYRKFSPGYTKAPPEYVPNKEQHDKVLLRGAQIIIKPGGFVLWITKEVIGTPTRKAKLICFVDGKSTRARTGLLVHMTAPTIHAKWSGQITLEIANLGPFDFVLEEGDIIAQIIVAQISSAPLAKDTTSPSTQGQRTVLGRKGDGEVKPSSRKRL